MTDDTILWDLKPHTAAKHTILRRYLQAWYPKLSWKGRLVFIDGFAGPGEYEGGEPGSPLISLKVAAEHAGNLAGCQLLFLFVEKDSNSARHLESLVHGLETPSNVNLQVIRGEFAEVFGGILDRLDAEGAGMAPALIMLDPFGFAGVPFNLIERAARHERTEFLISFMYESISRWTNLPNLESTYDQLFGCRDWRMVNACKTPDERKRFLIDLYVARLHKAGMEYVRTFEMIDEGGHTEYFLVFASHSLHGLKAMKEAMWKADPTGGARFSDATDPNQMTLFSEPDYALLKSLIITKFRGVDTPVEHIEEYILVETPFRETHFRNQILTPMEKLGELEVVTSPRRGSRGYPPGTVLRIS